MVRKLYYEDCHLSRFSARVTGCRQAETGWIVTLDATAFYPEGGGQACDTGTLNGTPVTQVREQAEEVLHYCTAPLEVGAAVEGVIDYDRRFELMQQHTGEHIVSGIIHRRYGYHNTGFHMGATLTEIDFDGVIPPEDLPSIEQEANEALWKNLPVICWYPDEETLPTVFYRTKRALPWPVRIVQVPGYDSCACCGVHVAATGEVGLIKIVSAMSFRGGTRMEMACGSRALQILNHAFDQNRQISQILSAKITETACATRKLTDQLAAEKFRSTRLQRQIFRCIADKYENCGDVVHFEPELDSAMLRELADAIAQCCGGRAAVFSGSDEEGYGYCLIARQGDLRPLGKAMTAALSGRGGGRPDAQQGRLRAARSQIAAFFKDWKTLF